MWNKEGESRHYLNVLHFCSSFPSLSRFRSRSRVNYTHLMVLLFIGENWFLAGILPFEHFSIACILFIFIYSSSSPCTHILVYVHYLFYASVLIFSFFSLTHSTYSVTHILLLLHHHHHEGIIWIAFLLTFHFFHISKGTPLASFAIALDFSPRLKFH